MFQQYTQFDAGKLQGGKGSGLGLWSKLHYSYSILLVLTLSIYLVVSKAIIDKLHGHVGAYSAGEGQGSTFFFEIPVKVVDQTTLARLSYRSVIGSSTTSVSPANVPPVPISVPPPVPVPTIPGGYGVASYGVSLMPSPIPVVPLSSSSSSAYATASSSSSSAYVSPSTSSLSPQPPPHGLMSGGGVITSSPSAISCPALPLSLPLRSSSLDYFQNAYTGVPSNNTSSDLPPQGRPGLVRRKASSRIHKALIPESRSDEIVEGERSGIAGRERHSMMLRAVSDSGSRRTPLMRESSGRGKRGSAVHSTTAASSLLVPPVPVTTTPPIILSIENQTEIIARQQLTILLADDSVLSRKLVERLILSSKLTEIDRIKHASNGIEAIDLVLHSGLRIDVVLIDYYMPGMNGPEAIQEMRKAGYHGIIFALSGTTADIDKARLLESGADYVICKPFDLKMFRLKLAGKLEVFYALHER